MGVTARFNEKANQFYLYVCHGGKRKAYPTGTTDVRAAEKLAKEKRKHLAKVGLGLPVVEAPVVLIPLKTYLETWLTGVVKERCKTTSFECYRDEVQNHIAPIIGHYPFDVATWDAKVWKEHVQELIAHWKATGLSTKSLRLILAVLSTAFTDAGVPMPSNPARPKASKLFCRQPDEVAHAVNPLTREETVTLLATILLPEKDGRAKPRPWAYTLFLLLLRTGMRLGEALALRWVDIDYANYRIGVHRSRNQKGIVTSPKRGSRYIDLSDELRDYLQALPQPTNRDTLICCTELGLPCEQKTVGDVFRRLLVLADFRHVRIHDLRHTFASQLLQDYAPIHYVKDQLGHKSIQMTVDLYSHLIPSVNRGFVNRLTPKVFKKEEAA